MRTAIIAGFVVLLVSTSLLFAPDKKEGADQKKPSKEEMMAMMMKLGTPGAEHEKLKQFEGTWDADVTIQMDASEQAMNSKGKMINKMILGGRYLQGDFKGEFMGMPFEGMSMTGYDNNKKQYQMGWIDSMSTMMVLSSGTADSAGKVFTFTATVDCPFAGGPQKMRQVLTVVDNDHHTFESYDIYPDGKEWKGMTIKYTRAKNENAAR
jgi:hypothetical protein